MKVLVLGVPSTEKRNQIMLHAVDQRELMNEVFSSRAIPSLFLCLQNPRVADRKDAETRYEFVQKLVIS